MIHVAIVCAGNSSTGRRYCTPLEGVVPISDMHTWYAKTLAEHAWTVAEDGETYCPKHNPADRGAPVELTSEAYLPLGDSGWEARALVPEGSIMMMSLALIEIRRQRGGDDA